VSKGDVDDQTQIFLLFQDKIGVDRFVQHLRSAVSVTEFITMIFKNLVARTTAAML
jgi:hypothetical protein